MLKVDHFNQSKDEIRNLAIYYTNCDRNELQLEINIYKPDLIILTEIFPKGIKSTDIIGQELKISGFNLILGKVTEKCRCVCIYIRNRLTFREYIQL